MNEFLDEENNLPNRASQLHKALIGITTRVIRHLTNRYEFKAALDDMYQEGIIPYFQRRFGQHLQILIEESPISDENIHSSKINNDLDILFAFDDNGWIRMIEVFFGDVELDYTTILPNEDVRNIDGRSGRKEKFFPVLQKYFDSDGNIIGVIPPGTYSRRGHNYFAENGSADIQNDIFTTNQEFYFPSPESEFQHGALVFFQDGGFEIVNVQTMRNLVENKDTEYEGKKLKNIVQPTFIFTSDADKNSVNALRRKIQSTENLKDNINNFCCLVVYDTNKGKKISYLNVESELIFETLKLASMRAELIGAKRFSIIGGEFSGGFFQFADNKNLIPPDHPFYRDLELPLVDFPDNILIPRSDYFVLKKK